MNQFDRKKSCVWSGLRLVASLLILSLCTTSTQAKRAHYQLDPVHSRISFTCGHDGFSRVIGTFSRPQGELWFDPDNWESAQIDVAIDLATLDMGDAGFNARLAKRDYFDTTHHPQARFTSHRIEPLSPNTAKIHGILQLRGVDVPVTLEATLNRMARSAYTLRRTIGFSATARLQRSLFGMTAHRKAVDDEVLIQIEVEAQRQSSSHSN